MRRAESHGPLLHLVVLADHVEVLDELARSQRGLRDREVIRLLADQEPHPQILTRKQDEVAVLDGRARNDRASRPFHAVVEEGEDTLVLRAPDAGDSYVGCDGATGPRRLDRGEVRLAGIEGHVYRIELD